MEVELQTELLTVPMLEHALRERPDDGRVKDRLLFAKRKGIARDVERSWHLWA